MDYKSLPWMPFSARHTFPSASCIYFVLSVDDDLLYVGMTRNALIRWRNHHRLADLCEYSADRVYFHFCEERLLRKLEKEFIKKLRPKINSIKHHSKPKRVKPKAGQKLQGQKRYITPNRRLKAFRLKWERESTYPQIVLDLISSRGSFPSNSFKYWLSDRTKIPYHSVPRTQDYLLIRKSVMQAAQDMGLSEELADYCDI